MYAIIAGCGRVGSQVARQLGERGDDVVVVDKDPASFRRLGDDFSGRALTGIVFDRATLEQAGIRKAQAFVAVTSGDNSNVVCARTAKEHFGVDRVVARIYDPRRAEIFERMGIGVVASARWTAESVLRSLSPPDERIEGTVGTGIGDVLMVTLKVPGTCHGVAAATISRPGHSVLAAITRAGNTVVPPPGALLESSDLVHLVVERASLDKVRQAVGMLGQEEH